MNQNQIAKLMETEHRLPRADPRKEWCHFRRAPSTADRDAIWQFTDRTPLAAQGWQTIPIPPMKTLFRLEPKGFMIEGHTRWQGFHDPAEYEKGN